MLDHPVADQPSDRLGAIDSAKLTASVVDVEPGGCFRYVMITEISQSDLPSATSASASRSRAVSRVGGVAGGRAEASKRSVNPPPN